MICIVSLVIIVIYLCLIEWYHRTVTTATAQANPNIAFTIYLEEKLD